MLKNLMSSLIGLKKLPMLICICLIVKILLQITKLLVLKYEPDNSVVKEQR